MKRVISLIIISVLLIASLKVLSGIAQERIALSTPEATPALTQYRLEAYRTEEDNPNTPLDDARFTIDLQGVQRDLSIRCEYNNSTTPTGRTVINGLKTANFSLPYADNATSGNLYQRIFHRLVRMNEAAQVCGRSLTGTVQ